MWECKGRERMRIREEMRTEFGWNGKGKDGKGITLRQGGPVNLEEVAWINKWGTKWGETKAIETNPSN